MISKYLLQPLQRLLHKKGAETQPNEFQALLDKTRDAVINSRELSLRLKGTEYYTVSVTADMINIGTLFTCLEALLFAMQSEGEDKYIHIPTFNEGFLNKRTITLDKLLVDEHSQWITFPNAIDRIEKLITNLGTSIDTTNIKMVDYYSGHSSRILSRTYNVFKQL